MKSRSL